MSDVTVSESALSSFIERASRDQSFDVAKFEALLRMQQEVAHMQARRAFNASMAACQSEMEPVLRSATNPGVRSKYAKLEDIDRQMRPIYTRHGFSVRFGSAAPPQPGWMRITCTVAHDGGYFEENYLDSPVTTTGSQGGRIAMTPVQAVGSVVTYLRRYLLSMVFNIVQADITGEDDDGEALRQQPGYIDRPRHTASSSRQAINAEVPLKEEPKQPAPKQTAKQFLEALDLEIRDAMRGPNIAEELDRIITGERVLLAQDHFSKSGMERHKERLDQLIGEALRVLNATHEPPDDEMPTEESADAAA